MVQTAMVRAKARNFTLRVEGMEIAKRTKRQEVRFSPLPSLCRKLPVRLRIDSYRALEAWSR